MTEKMKKETDPSSLMVTKDDGTMEEQDVSKIRKNTYFATLDLEGESADELEAKSKIHFYDGIPTSDIKKALISTATSAIDVDRPNATYVAARLYIYDLYHQYKRKMVEFGFERFVNIGVKEGRLNPALLNYSLPMYEELIEMMDDKVMSKDYLFTLTAITNFDQKVLRRDNDGNLAELPQYVLLANSMMLGFGEENHFEFVKNHYATTSGHYMMTSTPTLSNSRGVRPQMSSCYIGATPDNIEGINKFNSNVSLLSKFGGGIGWDWNDIRAPFSSVDNVVGASGGPVPFLKVANDISQAVDQLGRP